jgi:predicted transcriptional regulator
VPEKQTTDEDVLRMTAEIVTAYVSANTIDPETLPDVVRTVAGALRDATNGVNRAPAAKVSLTPAVSIRKSVTPDYIICLEDGRKMKTLRRHLSKAFGLTPDAYRAKWNLPSDYPMVAPNYAAVRSEMAKARNFGKRV